MTRATVDASTHLPAVRRSGGLLAAWLAPAAAALSVLLAWGAVSPVHHLAAERIGILPGSPLAWGSAIAVLGIGLWFARRGRTLPLWIAPVTLLPWVPVHATGMGLLWHGALADALLGGVALLIAWPAIARVAATVLARPPRQQALAACAIAALLYGAAAWRMQPLLPDGDEPHYLVITQSLLLDRDLRIENNHRRGDYAAYSEVVLKPDMLRRGKDGQVYSVHAPGTSVLVLPAFALGGYPAAVAWLVTLSALGAALLWDTAWRVTGSASAAWVGWAGAALSVPFFLHAFMVFPDAPGAVIVMALVSALAVPERLRSTATCAALGAAAAVLPWLHTRFALVAGIAGVLIGAHIAATPDRRFRRIGALAAVPVVSLGGWLWFFYSIYGSVNPGAPYGGYTQSALGNVPRGLAGLLLDQQFGVLPNAPAFAAALGGLVVLWRVRRRLALELALLTIPYAIAVAAYHMWWGGRSAPARFLVIVLLPLGVPLAACWQRARRADRALIAAAVIASLALSFGLAWVGRGALAFNLRDGYARWADAVTPMVRWPLAFPSLFRQGVGQAVTVAAAWAAVCAAGLAVLRVVERRVTTGKDADGDRWRTCVAASVVLIVTLGSAAGWAAGGFAPADTGNGLLRVARMTEGAVGPGWRSSRPFSLGPAEPLIEALELPTPQRRLPAADGAAWLGTDLPAGRYEVDAPPGVRHEVLFGAQRTLLAEATFGAGPTGPPSMSIMLPAGASELRVTADAGDATAASSIRVRLAAPIAVRGAGGGVHARAVVRGQATAWLADGNAYAEPGGLWVRGGAETTLVVDGEGRSAELVLRAGPVATTCALTVGRADPRLVTLAPGALQTIVIPAATPIAVRVGSTAGFRPRDHDPANADVRWLGVRVEVR